MQNTPNDWSRNEFMVFTMLYAANVDSHITPDEEELMQQKVPTERYQEIRDTFKGCSDYKCIETILSYRDKYFATEEDHQQLMDAMKAVFESDHRYTGLERHVMRLFDRMT
jgi:hypothetical protein